ncbi:hypothetical protein [Archangium violaceum]|nr:hypothetical protein [Archangium violaceum]
MTAHGLPHIHAGVVVTREDEDEILGRLFPDTAHAEGHDSS